MLVKPVRPRVAILAAGGEILGGHGTQAMLLIESLRNDGYRTTFLPINPPPPAGLRWMRRVPVLRTIILQLLYLPSLLRLARVDVVHAFSAAYWSFLVTPVPAMIAGRLFGKRVILHYHSGEADDHLTRWGWLVHPWLRLAHEIVVPSEYLREIFARHGYQVRVIRNIVDLSRFRFRERRACQPRLVSTRNLEPYYRVDIALRAFARVREHYPNATLVVAGYGRQEASLRALAVELGADGVQFVGRVEPANMPKLLGAADIFVNTSVLDNQPVSILEAFAAGTPVVSTPPGDIPALVRSGDTGWLVDGPDPELIAQAILDVLRSPEKALGAAWRARRELGRYTWPAVRKSWESAYAGTEAAPHSAQLASS